MTERIILGIVGACVVATLYVVLIALADAAGGDVRGLVLGY